MNAPLADAPEKWKPVSRQDHAQSTSTLAKPTERAQPVKTPRPQPGRPQPQAEFESQPPRRGLKLSGFAIFGLLAVLFVGDQIRLHRPDHKFRLVVEVETPDGVKSAANIYSVTPNRGYGGSNTGETSGPQTKGDAVFVNLGGGRNVVALLAVGTDPVEFDATNYIAMRSFLAAGPKVQFRDMKKTTALSPVPVPAENAPVLVTFKDVNDPASMRRLTADNVQQLLGPGVKLRSMTVSTVANGFWPVDIGGALGEPVTRGIEAKLPWLKGEAAPANQAALSALNAAGIKGFAIADAKRAFVR
jgi:hypothetical protein